METKLNTEWKLAHQLEVGDKTSAFGLNCLVTKVELIFHYAPDSRARIELIELTTKEKAILFLPRNVAVETYK